MVISSVDSNVHSGATLIVMPARNESERIQSLVTELYERLPNIRILVVDDASTDGTPEVAEEAGALVVRLPFHLGYGAALQTGYKFAAAHGFDFVVQMDSDGQHRPVDVLPLLEHVTNGTCDLVVGSRFLVDPAAKSHGSASGYEMGALRTFARRTLCFFARIGGLEIADPTSGFQAMNRRVLLLFASNWYPSDYPDVDVLLLAHRRGMRVHEHPVDMAPSPRPSTLHSGWLPIYYAYRMALALWALSAVPRSRELDGDQ